MFADTPSAPGAVSACAHQQAWEYSRCLCTPATDTHRVLSECKAAKNILPLQTYLDRTAASTFWDSSQFTFSRERNHINHTSLDIAGKTCKSYQTSRICFLLISHMLSHTQGLKSTTTVSLPTLTIGLCWQQPLQSLPSGHVWAFALISPNSYYTCS